MHLSQGVRDGKQYLSPASKLGVPGHELQIHDINVLMQRDKQVNGLKIGPLGMD